jgi:hypothetical protein
LFQSRNLRCGFIWAWEEVMAEFGKRGVARDPRALSQPVAASPDLAVALAAVKTGRLPYWANVGPVRIVVILLAAAATFWWLILPYAGDILRDHRLAGTWQPAYDMQVTDGRCTRHNFILTVCNATLKSRAEPNQTPLQIGFMMAFSSGSGQPLLPVRSTVDPARLTVAYAAETQLLNRTLTFIVMAGGLATAFLTGLSALLQGRYVGGAAHRALMAGLEDLKARVQTAQDDRRAST